MLIDRGYTGRRPLRPADVAQLVEHFTRNEGVPGSSPGVGLKRFLGAVLAAGVLAAVASGAGARLHPGAPFDGAYAYRLTKLQVDAGPRPAGSATQRAVAE